MSYRPQMDPFGSRPPTTILTGTRSASRTTAYCASPRPENRMSPVEDTLRSTRDAYPADLARFVRERWDEDRAGTLPDQEPGVGRRLSRMLALRSRTYSLCSAGSAGR